mgnify:CR=1 FL=1
MSLLPTIGAVDQDTGFYNGVATQSLRFDDGSSAFLHRTPSGAGNQKTWTFSAWIKPSNVTISRSIFARHDSGSNTFLFRLDQNDDLQVENYTSSAYQLHLVTDAKFRDISAWYHVVLSLDTTQGTAANRAKLYVNGVQKTSFSSSTYPSQNADLKVNAAAVHRIGARAPDNYFDGYMAEVNFVDGLALDPTYFGETKNGVWVPKKYTGSYGTNGFRLQFDQTGVGTASTSTIGADTSGNTHHFTSSGIVASDCNMPDSPENNFATFNVLSGNSSTTISEGNLRALANNSSNYLESQNSTFGITSGKWYAEFRADDLLNDGADNGTQIGVTTAPYNRGSGNQNGAITGSTRINLDNSGGAYLGVNTSVTQQGSIGTYADGDIIGVALNVDDSEVSFYKNGSAITNAQDISITDVNGVYFFEVQIRKVSSDTSQITANFGQDDTFAGAISSAGNTDGNGIGVFKYAPPSGFLALCSANLPEPTIGPNSATQADDYFNTVLYTGNGSGQSITGVGFQPDWVWAKERSSGSSHQWYDSSRGVTNRLESDNTGDEDVIDGVTSFDTDGFTIGTHSAINDNGITNVAWNWKANGGTTSSNTDGSITSTVQANTDAGFSIVTYTGNGSAGATVGHSLGTKPEMIILKERNASGNWVTYHEYANANAQNGYIALNLTSAWTSNSASWNNTSPTSSVFTLGNGTDVNTNNHTMLAYCFHSVEGYSRFGSYTGNGINDGTFVHLGFRPAWIMVKRTNTTGEWGMHDSVRDTYNVVSRVLLAESSSAEIGGLTFYDFISNGFKLRDTNANRNASGSTYIYMAFAENPFKYANAR